MPSLSICHLALREREREVQQWQNATPNAERYSLSDNCMIPGRCQVLGNVDFQSLENGCRLEAEERGSGKRRCMRVGLPRCLHGQTAWWRRSTYICPNHYSPLRHVSSRFPPPIHGIRSCEHKSLGVCPPRNGTWLENAGLERAGTLEIFVCYYLVLNACANLQSSMTSTQSSPSLAPSKHTLWRRSNRIKASPRDSRLSSGRSKERISCRASQAIDRTCSGQTEVTLRIHPRTRPSTTAASTPTSWSLWICGTRNFQVILRGLGPSACVG